MKPVPGAKKAGDRCPRGPGIEQTLDKCRDDEDRVGGDGNSVTHWVEPWLLGATPELPTPLHRRRISFQKELGATRSLRLSTQVAPAYPGPVTQQLAQV